MTENTALTVAQTTALSEESRKTLDGLILVRDVLTPDLTIPELQLFAVVANRSGLDPFARQIYAVKRAEKMTIQTGIDGYRSIAVRTGEYDGQDEPTFGPPCECGRGTAHPESSTVKVYRKGMSRAVGATAYWHEYVPDPGQSGKGDQMWRKMPHVMIAKVAEALALRKAFPWDPNRGTGIGGDVYTAEEMAQADHPPVVSVQERVAARAVSAPGVDLRTFADAVAHMDPGMIRETRAALFPEASGVATLSDQQRSVLLARLLEIENGTEIEGEAVEVQEETEDAGDGGKDGPPLVQQSQAEPEEDPVPPAPEGVDVETGEILNREEVAEGARVLRASPPGTAMVACDDPSPFSSLTCLLPKAHRGFHRGSETEAWPRKG